MDVLNTDLGNYNPLNFTDKQAIPEFLQARVTSPAGTSPITNSHTGNGSEFHLL